VPFAHKTIYLVPQVFSVTTNPPAIHTSVTSYLMPKAIILSLCGAQMWAFSMKTLTKSELMTREEVEVLLIGVRGDLGNRNIRAYMKHVSHQSKYTNPR
jgi:hypothetical protein